MAVLLAAHQAAGEEDDPLQAGAVEEIIERPEATLIAVRV